MADPKPTPNSPAGSKQAGVPPPPATPASTSRPPDATREEPPPPRSGPAPVVPPPPAGYTDPLGSRAQPSFSAQAEAWIRQNETVALVGAFAVGVVIGLGLRR